MITEKNIDRHSLVMVDDGGYYLVFTAPKGRVKEGDTVLANNTVYTAEKVRDLNKEDYDMFQFYGAVLESDGYHMDEIDGIVTMFEGEENED